jgi:hypothetical protein
MIFQAAEAECLPRRAMVLSGIVDAALPAPIRASASDAPGVEATKALAHATIHPAVTGAATQTSVGASGATDWADLIAVN